GVQTCALPISYRLLLLLVEDEVLASDPRRMVAKRRHGALHRAIFDRRRRGESAGEGRGHADLEEAILSRVERLALAQERAVGVGASEQVRAFTEKLPHRRPIRLGGAEDRKSVV